MLGIGIEIVVQGKPVAVFELEDNEQTRAMWNYRFSDNLFATAWMHEHMYTSHPHAKKKVLSGMNDFFNSKIDLSNEVHATCGIHMFYLVASLVA